MKNKNSKKNKLLWSVIFVIIAALSVWAVIAQNKNFSFRAFLDFFTGASPMYIVVAVLCMFAFILFEGLALKCICGAFGYKFSVKSSISYSSADIYFSAITPSASGGQPASGYFMVKDGVPPIFATVALIVNLMMYVLSIVVIGIICIIFYPSLFSGFGTVSEALIILGIIVQSILFAVLFLLLKNERILLKICSKLIRIMNKLHLTKKADSLQKRLENKIVEYKEYSAMLSGKTGMLIKAFLLNFFQRALQIAVVPFVFLASGGSFSAAVRLWFMQSYVVIGSNCVPIPGAVGVTDYLMLDGFSALMPAAAATNLELLSRSLSFYICVFLCGIITLIKYILVKKKRG